MTDLCLRFESEEQAKSVLFDGELPNYRNIDTIGVIYKPTGKMLQGEDGTEYPAMAPVKGWHVNVRLVDGEDVEAIELFVVIVNTPERVWA